MSRTVNFKRTWTSKLWTHLIESDPEKNPDFQNFWKPNRKVTNCENESCERLFDMFIRKHHCRECGGIFCSSCLSKNKRCADCLSVIKSRRNSLTKEELEEKVEKITPTTSNHNTSEGESLDVTDSSCESIKLQYDTYKDYEKLSNILDKQANKLLNKINSI